MLADFPCISHWHCQLGSPGYILTHSLTNRIMYLWGASMRGMLSCVWDTGVSGTLLKLTVLYRSRLLAAARDWDKEPKELHSHRVPLMLK